MNPSGDYKRFEIEIVNRYEDYDIPITFGILIADYRQRNCSDYIINYLKECFGLNSKLNIDLCIVKDELELINFFRNFKFTTSYVLNAGTSKSVNPGLRIVRDKK